MREVGEQIGFGNGCRGAADASGCFEDGLAQFDEDAFLDFNASVVCGEDLALEFFELGRGETFGVDQGLLALVIGWRKGHVGLGDLDVVTEDRVIADLEGTDAGAGAFALFNGRDGLAAGGGDGAQLIEFRVDAGGDCAAIGECQRRLGNESGFNAGCDFIQDIEARGDFLPERRMHRVEGGFQRGQAAEAGCKRTHIARAGGIETETCEETFEIENAGEGTADFFAAHEIAMGFADGFIARVQRLGIVEWTDHGCAQ